MRSNQELEQLRTQAIALRRAGKSRREIKEILGVGNSTLDPALRGEPPPLWTARPNAKDDLHAKARDLRAQGCTYDEIAAELGVSKASVSLWVRDMPRRGRISYEEFRKRNAAGRVQVLASREAASRGRTAGDRDAAAIADRRISAIGRSSSPAPSRTGAKASKNKPYRREDRVVFINSDPG